MSTNNFNNVKIDSQVVREAARFVSAFLSANLKKEFQYHDFFHTFSVVQSVDMLSNMIGINKNEKRILLVAAWFHDTGYTKQPDDHEAESAAIAEKFLSDHNVCEEDIIAVKACILATRYPQQTTNLPEQIICDADLHYISEPNFMERSELLRKEWASAGKHYTDKEWHESNTQFLIKHTFQTAYCRQHFTEGKLKNIKRIKARLEEINKSATAIKKEKVETNMNGRKEKQQRTERGVETFFRIASGNHMKLSDMADNKAHILLSINSIIISVVLSVLVKNLSEIPYLVFPTIFLLTVCVITTVFAVLTTKPKVSKGIFTEDQIHNREVNLLFFGNFHSMGYEFYEWGVQEMMNDKQYLYKSMTKDIYFLGKVLAKKYRYLNIGYKIFMYGLVASVFAFGFSFLFAS
jgi:predicted metal-dependent HD superfamily phosphohydrolase